MAYPRLVAAGLLAIVLPTLVTPNQAYSADDEWGPLRSAGGSALAVALNGRTTALISVGGRDDATIYDQRRTARGALGARTRITTVRGARSCRPVEAVTARNNVAVAVECLTRTGLEDPPTRLVELVWTGDDGWVWRVQKEGRLASIDYSPRGQFVVFSSNSGYGRPHHLTSYHPDLGWRELKRRELDGTGDDLVAAVTDSGDLVALRGSGSEDEPGYWFGGRLRIETYDATTGTWALALDRDHPDGGIDPAGIDVAAGRIAATLVESRSTGKLHGLEDRVVLLSGDPGDPRSWSSRWAHQVLAASEATTRTGVGVFAWHATDGRRSAKPWFAAWTPGDEQPSVRDLRWRTTLTPAAVTGQALDLSVSASGHGAIAWVRHRPGADHSSVAGVSFRVGRDGELRHQIDATWRQPMGVTVDVTAAATATSITLGLMTNLFVPSSETRYSVGP